MTLERVLSRQEKIQDTLSKVERVAPQELRDLAQLPAIKQVVAAQERLLCAAEALMDQLRRMG